MLVTLDGPGADYFFNQVFFIYHREIKFIDTSVRRGAIYVLLGDFNDCDIQYLIPTYNQFVNCTTTDNKTLDLFFCKLNVNMLIKLENVLPWETQTITCTGTVCHRIDQN